MLLQARPTADGTPSPRLESATHARAIPSGFEEDNLYVEAFEAPTDGCDVPADTWLPFTFSANWSNGDGGLARVQRVLAKPHVR